jgi:hypothetical protein
MLDMYPKVSNVTEYISLEDRVIFKTIVERRNKQEIFEAMAKAKTQLQNRAFRMITRENYTTRSPDILNKLGLGVTVVEPSKSCCIHG